MSQIPVEVILPGDKVFSAPFSGRGTIAEVKNEVFDLPEMAGQRKQNYLLGLDQDNLMESEFLRLFECHPNAAAMIKEGQPLRFHLFPKPGAPAAPSPLSPSAPAAPKPLTGKPSASRDDILNRLQDLHKLVAEQDEQKKILMEKLENQNEERRAQQMEKQRALSKMIEFQEQFKKEEQLKAVKEEKLKRFAQMEARFELLESRKREMRKNRLAFVRKEKKQIKVTHELPKIQNLVDMCMIDLDVKTINQYFTQEVIESCLSSLEETRAADDYTIQIGLTQLLLAIAEVFRKRFPQERNLFRKVLLTGIHKITLVENAFFVALGLFPSNKVTFWHSLLFIYDLLSSPVSAILIDKPYIAELAPFLHKQLSIIPPESAQSQLLFLEMVKFMVANTTYSKDCPAIFDLYSVLQTVAVSAGKPDLSDDDSDSASYLSSEGDLGNADLAKNILSTQISSLLGKHKPK